MPPTSSRAPHLAANAIAVPRPVHTPSRGESGRAGRSAHPDLSRLGVPSPPYAARSAPTAPPDARTADVLRIVSDSRTPAFATVHAGGRIRYGYWRPVDSATGRGGCYVALPTDVCEALRSGGRIVMGEPVTDPSKTTYRVRPARPPGDGVPPRH
jgi:hypothetical protein